MRQQGLETFKVGLQRTLNTAADLILLNLLLILCCLPVVTAGAAWVAGYATVLRILRGEEQSFPFKPFLYDFKKSFKQATLSWLLLLVCLAILAGDYYYAVYASQPVNQFFLVFAIVMAFVLMMAAIWLFPLIARYQNTFGGTIRNAFLLAAGLFPRTLAAFLVQFAFLCLPFLVPSPFEYFGWLWALFGLSIPVYLTAKLFRKTLDSELKTKDDENGQD